MTPRQMLKQFFPPMLASLADGPPADDTQWHYELKYDGFRGVVAIRDGAVAMLSRNELDLSGRFPRIMEALQKVRLDDVIVDGEIVVLDEQGAPRFQLLQKGGKERLILFDILRLHGEDLRRLPYEERRAILKKAFARPPAGIFVAQTLEMGGEEALRYAAEGGWEGIIAKRKGSFYEPRRSKAWLKVKAIQQQELIIVGWQPSSAGDHEIGSLHLAVHESGGLRYAGKVGTGFSAKMRSWLRKELAKDVVAQATVGDAPRIRTAVWVKPRLVAQVAFTEWTSDHRLRHPSFLGLREDKEVQDVVREKPAAAAKTKSPARTAARAAASKEPKARSAKEPGARSQAVGAKHQAPGTRHQVPGTSPRASAKKVTAAEKGSSTKAASATPAASRVTLSNPGRLLYPRDGFTKEDVAGYYAAVAEPMLRALRDRPLAIEHWNQGIDQPSWFQQNIGREGPPWLRLAETPARTSERSVKHLIADSPDTLRWLAQMSVLTVHMWSARATALEEPDWILFDLDPAKGKGIEQAIEAADVMRRLLETLELPSVPKTSGKRGIHVFVPLRPGYTHEQVTDFACSIAAAIAAKVPGITVERALAKRRGRLYLDCMQNGYGKTVVAPYSLRALDGAPVSAPLLWSEITKSLDPLRFNLRTMPDRLAKVGDLFAAVFENRAKLPVLK